MKISILGGAGKFGRHLAKHLEDENEIRISASTPESAEEAAKNMGGSMEKTPKS